MLVGEMALVLEPEAQAHHNHCKNGLQVQEENDSWGIAWGRASFPRELLLSYKLSSHARLSNKPNSFRTYITAMKPQHRTTRITTTTRMGFIPFSLPMGACLPGSDGGADCGDGGAAGWGDCCGGSSSGAAAPHSLQKRSSGPSGELQLLHIMEQILNRGFQIGEPEEFSRYRFLSQTRPTSSALCQFSMPVLQT